MNHLRSILLAAALVVVASPAAVAQTLVLDLDNITGEATVENYEGAIELIGFTASSEVGSARSGDRRRRGRASFGPVTVSKRVDLATDDLLDRMWTGRVIKRGALVLLMPAGGELVEVMRIDMGDVRVTSYNVSSDADGAFEEIRLEFARVWHSYRTVGDDGQPGSLECSGWDLERGTPASCPPPS